MGGGATYTYLRNYQETNPVNFAIIDSSFVDFESNIKDAFKNKRIPY
jgi:hypothetical protein